MQSRLITYQFPPKSLIVGYFLSDISQGDKKDEKKGIMRRNGVGNNDWSDVFSGRVEAFGMLG